MTLTIKIYDDVYAHKDIVESGKDHKDITSLLRLGKTLKIDQETFEDLDEVSNVVILFVLCTYTGFLSLFSLIMFEYCNKYARQVVDFVILIFFPETKSVKMLGWSMRLNLILY